MAIMDKYLEFCDATSVPTAVGSTTFGNQVELSKAALPKSGKGSPVYLHLKVSTAFQSGGSATIAFNLEHAGTNSAASYSAAAAILPATAVATYAAGYSYIMALPAINLKRFVRVKSTVATSPLTAGAVDIWLDLSDADR